MKAWAVLFLTMVAAGTMGVAPSSSRGQTASVISPQAGTARITGTVVSEGGDAPLPVNRAFVMLSGDGLRRVILSDGEGRFAFDALPDGTYLITAAKAGFVTSAYGALRPGGDGTAVVVQAGQIVADLHVRLVRGGVITGAILGADGEPAPNVRVTARLAGRAASRSPTESAVTDDRGVYRIFGLTPGEYLVEATPALTSGAGMRVMSVSAVDAELADLARLRGGGRALVNLPSRGRGPSGPDTATSYSYAPVFYPSTTRVEDAVPIEVSAGAERTAVDFSLVLAGTTTISGTVRGPGGELVSDVQVTAIRAGSAAAPLGLRPTRAFVRGPDATYRIANVTPGRYAVRAQTMTPGAGGTTSHVGQWASEDVEVVGSPITGLALRLQPARTISGAVIFKRTVLPAPDLSTMRVALRPRAGAGGLGISAPPPAGVRSDGGFHIVGVTPDTYDVEILGAPGLASAWWPRSALLDGRDLLDEPLVVGAATSTTDVRGLVVTHADQHTSLSGRLDHPAGRPAPEHVVLAFAADSRLWLAARRIAATRPASDGQFEFRDLPPGEYFLGVVTDIPPDAWRLPEFLSSVREMSIRVAIGEGEQRVQNLRIGR